MNAIILCGGYGERLRPLTDNVPKPMLTVANAPILDYTVSHLYQFGIREFVYTLAFRPEQVIDFAIAYSGVQCRFSIETLPLGTLGGIKACEQMLSDVFLVTSGDLIEDINFELLLHKHFSSSAQVTMAVTEVLDPSQFGVCQLDGFGRVTDFTEKPKSGSEKSKLANCGVYVFNRSVLKDLPEGMKLDIAVDLLPALVKKGQVAAYIHDGYWRDAGTHAAYYAANFECACGGFFEPAPHRARDRYASFRTAFGQQSVISASAVTEGNVRRCVVGAHAYIEKNAELDGCVVLEKTQVSGRHQNCIIGDSFVIPIESTPIIPDIWTQSSKFF